GLRCRVRRPDKPPRVFCRGLASGRECRRLQPTRKGEPRSPAVSPGRAAANRLLEAAPASRGLDSVQVHPPALQTWSGIRLNHSTLHLTAGHALASRYRCLEKRTSSPAGAEMKREFATTDRRHLPTSLAKMKAAQTWPPASSTLHHLPASIQQQ